MVAGTTTELSSIPSDVLDIATRNELTSCLRPILSIARDIFRGRSIELRAERDAEIESEEHIVIEVDVTDWSVDDIFSARNRWSQEFCRICPPKNSIIFQVRLMDNA